MRFRLVATQEEMVKSCSRKGFEMVEEKRTSDFRRRTSADVSGGRCVRRPRGWRVAASGSPASDVRIPLSATARGLSPAGLGKYLGHAEYIKSPDDPQWVYNGKNIGETRFRSFVKTIFSDLSVKEMPTELSRVLDNLYAGEFVITEADEWAYQQANEFFSRNGAALTQMVNRPRPRWIPKSHYSEVLRKYANSKRKAGPFSQSAHNDLTKSPKYIEEVRKVLEGERNASAIGVKDKLDCCLRKALGK